MFGETKIRVGVSDKNQIAKKPFAQAYDGWPGTHVLSNLDAGLVRVDDLSQWTTQVVGLGSVDRPADLTTDTITLDLIGCPVCAFGGASGPLLGQIDALFYRYKSVGGVDYVADLLIGPEWTGRSPNSRARERRRFSGRGNPGTLQETREPSGASSSPGRSDSAGAHAAAEAPETDAAPDRPAVGRARRRRGGVAKSTAHSYALATCLSTVCRELDVDLVRDWNSGLPEYWETSGTTP